MRVQRFEPGDVVFDLDGVEVCILEASQDPHPADFSHCAGVSARYTVRLPSRSNATRWDWQLVHPSTCNTFSARLASMKEASTRRASS